MLRIIAIISASALAAGLLMSGSCGHTPARIAADLEGVPEGRVYLTRVTDGVWERIDSTTAVNGVFAIKVPDIVPDILYVQFASHPDFRIPVVVDGRDVFINGDALYNEQVEVTGTPPNDLLTDYRRSVAPIVTRSRIIESALEPYRDSTALADSATYVQLLQKHDDAEAELRSFRSSFVRENPASIVSAMIVAGEATASTPRRRIDSLIGELDTENMHDNVFLRRLRERQNEAYR